MSTTWHSVYTRIIRIIMLLTVNDVENNADSCRVYENGKCVCLPWNVSISITVQQQQPGSRPVFCHRGSPGTDFSKTSPPFFLLLFPLLPFLPPFIPLPSPILSSPSFPVSFSFPWVHPLNPARGLGMPDRQIVTGAFWAKIVLFRENCVQREPLRGAGPLGSAVWGPSHCAIDGRAGLQSSNYSCCDITEWVCECTEAEASDSFLVYLCHT